MSCRFFESHVADWMSRRLPPERARAMAAHQQICASCARTAHAETALRAKWQDAAAAVPPIEIRHRLDIRLGTPAPRFYSSFATSRWAWGVAALLVVSLCGNLMRSFTSTAPGDYPPIAVSPAPETSAAAPSPNTVAYAALADVPRVDPAVDDPARRSVEQFWTRLASANVAGEQNP